MTETTDAATTERREGLLAPLGRDDLPSFLVALGTARVLAATNAAAALGLTSGAPAPAEVMAVAHALAQRHLPQARLERVRLPGGFVPRLFLCAAVSLPAGRCVLFADPAAAAANDAPQGAPEPSAPSRAIPPELYDAPPRILRFAWEADPQGRLVALSAPLLRSLGAQSRDVLGQTFADLEALGLIEGAQEIADALALRAAFAGVRLRVPRVPPFTLELGGIPLLDAARRHLGTRGFGVLVRPLTAQARAADPAAAEPETPADNAAPAPEAARPGNVIALRSGVLTQRERSAFREIARTLGAAVHDWSWPGPTPASEGEGADAPRNTPQSREGAEPADPPPRQPEMASAAAESSSAPAGARPPPDGAPAEPTDTAAPTAARDEREVLDRLPFAVVVQQDGTETYANRTFFHWIGRADLAAFQAAGGLDGHLARDGAGEALYLLSHTGASVPVEVRLLTGRFAGRPAMLHVMRRLDTPAEAAASEPQSDPLSPLDRVPLPLLRLDRDGTILRANAEAARWSGFSAAALAGAPFTVLLAPESQEAGVRLLDGEPSDAPSGADLTLRRRDGTLQPGRALLLRSTPQDRTTSQHEAEDGWSCLAFLPASAAPQHKDMDAGLARRIADGLAAPLARIAACREAGADPATALAALEEMLGQTREDLDRLTAAPDAGTNAEERADLCALAQTVLDDARPSALRRRVALRADLPGHLQVKAPAAPLARLIRLTLGEALTASPDCGQVIVSAHLQTHAGGVDAVLLIADEGPACDEVTAARALPPFPPLMPIDRFSAAGRPLRFARLAAEAEALGVRLRLRPRDGRGMTAELTLSV